MGTFFTYRGIDVPDSLMGLIGEDLLWARNMHGIAFEKTGDIAGAVSLYEANIADRFDGSHPYERLMIIYARERRHEDARRVARACMVQATTNLSDRLRARCAKVLAAAPSGQRLARSGR